MSLTKVNQQEMDSLSSKLKKIKCVLLDVDGVLTDGRVVFMGKEVGWNRFSTSMTGMLKMLKQKNFHIEHSAELTGLYERFQHNLGLDPNMLYFGNEEKMGAYEEIKSDMS